MLRLLNKGAGNVFGLIVEKKFVNGFCVDRNAEGLPNPDIVEWFSPHVIANVGVAESEAGEYLEAGILSQAIDLMAPAP